MLASVGLALIFRQNNADLLAEVEYIEAQVNFAATREFGISPFDITQTPAADFIATATAYADFEWEPISETFDGVEMVLVPAGCFYMGSNENSDEQPRHEVCFDDPFWIDKYEVTNEQFGSTGCKEQSSEPDQPRNCVDWFEALEYCQARDATLPTEAQWEYAARGPDSLVYPWGNEYNADLVIGRGGIPGYLLSGTRYTQTAPVGSRSGGASWVGALDMSGNVWEWTSTWYEDYPYDSTDGRESDILSRTRAILPVSRGGAFHNIVRELRSAYRDWSLPGNSNSYRGVRCARYLD